MKRRFSSILMLGIFLLATVPLKAVEAETLEKQKSHKWLIPVGAAAGFGLGLLIGFRAYDEAINSDQKIWTTAIVGGVIGGVGGWFASSRMSRGSEKFVWPAQSVNEKITDGLRADSERRRANTAHIIRNCPSSGG